LTDEGLDPLFTHHSSSRSIADANPYKSFIPALKGEAFSCNMDCLYCQNHVFKTYASRMKPFISIDDLVNAVNDKTTCVCFFGGDPAVSP